MDRVIGIGEYTISDNPDDIIKTYALSSCVALTVYSPVKRILGMVHIALPNSETAQNSIVSSPAYYADAAVPLLINKISFGYGCPGNELEIRLFGGAESMRKDDVFNIGKRNLEAIETKLRQLSLRACYRDIGGFVSRSVEADVATGTVKVICQPLRI